MALATLLELTTIDLKVAHLFYDESRGLWPQAHSAWCNEWLHLGGRDFVFLLGLIGIGLFLVSFFQTRWRHWRRPAAFLVASIALSTGLVASLKQITNVDCPRRLTEFGGDRPYVRLFADRPDDLPRAHCFPGAHSSSAFSLFSLFFILRDRGRWKKAASRALAGASLLGFLFAFGQWARGAHFVSHDLWSAFLCWAMVLGLYWGPFRSHLWPASGPLRGEPLRGEPLRGEAP